MSNITTLIDKQDTFEIVRDKIASILFKESAAQVALATSSGKLDPSEWALRVYTERATPWDDYTTSDIIANVWFDNASVNESSSNTVVEQTMRGTYNIDVIAFGASKANGTGGQSPGDEMAALNAQRGMRIVRNIIMASHYTYLGLRTVVGQRMPQAISSFQPQLNSKPTEHAVGMRLALGVRYEEYSPQYEPGTLQELGVIVERADDGAVFVELEYEYPLTQTTGGR